MCECRKIVDAELKAKNARLAFGFTLGAGTMERSPPIIELEKIDAKKRGKPPILLATYCPFCGKKFATDKPKITSKATQGTLSGGLR